MAKKALFLDRDGVINVEKNYLFKINDIEFIEETIEFAKKYQSCDYLIIVITNQAGIARKKYTYYDFHRLNEWMLAELKTNHHLNIDAVYYCPHHPDFDGPCECRKPKPGMILQAAKEHHIDLSKSILIGDKDSDLEAGFNAGIDRCYHIEELIEGKIPFPD